MARNLLKSPFVLLPMVYLALVMLLVRIWGPADLPEFDGSAGGLVVKDASVIEDDSSAPAEPLPPLWPEGMTQEQVMNLCADHMDKIPGKFSEQNIYGFCSKVKWLAGCISEEGVPIYNYDKLSEQEGAKKIFALALIHGDEHPSGAVARAWMSRLERIQPRNSWRVVPVANPDGWARGTRVNSRGVDLNRNFPTDDWQETALRAWEQHGSRPRRYPGPSGASESETRCLMSHFRDFQPDFIVSVHTPLGVLDFDGPQMSFPHVDRLPWISLGHFPGSLGRYMWRDHDVPVLTIELKGQPELDSLAKFDQLQDISGAVAIQADELVRRAED